MCSCTVSVAEENLRFHLIERTRGLSTWIVYVRLALPRTGAIIGQLRLELDQGRIASLFISIASMVLTLVNFI